MGAVVVLGSINADLVVRTVRHPRPGETLLGGPFSIYQGGKGANQAVAAARMGADARMVGCVGRDAFGVELVAGLVDAGVDVTAVRRIDGASGVALITVDDSGENTIVVAPGANGSVTAEGLSLAGVSVLLAQLEVPLDVVAAAFAQARSAGVTTMLNAAPAAFLEPSLLASVDVLVVNEHELQTLGPSPCPHVVLTLGARGTVVDGVAIAAHRVEIVDTTGAGDASCGVLAAVLAGGASLHDAARWGNAAGAVACTIRGARLDASARARIEALLA